MLCSSAVMRAGAGLVTIGIPHSLNTALIKIKLPEVMTLPLPQTRGGCLSPAAYGKIMEFMRTADIMVAGPGLDEAAPTHALVRRIVVSGSKPVVLDASGIGAFAGKRDTLRACRRNGRSPLIMTPHPGEMARFLGITVSAVQAARKEVAQKASVEYNITTVLKGYHTVIASPDGRCAVNTTGNPGMSTAGSGDVLAGIIAAFLGQGLDAFDAARYGAYVHGLAGDLAAAKKTQIGMIASDIIAAIPDAIKAFS